MIIGLGGAAIAAADNLIDHGGLVLTNPKLYIVYWGTDWQTGFTDALSGLPSVTYQAYLKNFDHMSAFPIVSRLSQHGGSYAIE